MIQKTSALMIGVFSLFVISCDNAPKETATETPAIAEQEEHTFNEVKDTDTKKIWPANMETTVGFASMSRILADFTEIENPEAYLKLEEDLKVEYRLIFKNCTMTGEAHDHLHEYIMPFSEMFKRLKSTDVEVSKVAYADLKAHLDDYKNRFK